MVIIVNRFYRDFLLENCRVPNSSNTLNIQKECELAFVNSPQRERFVSLLREQAIIVHCVVEASYYIGSDFCPEKFLKLGRKTVCARGLKIFKFF